MDALSVEYPNLELHGVVGDFGGSYGIAASAKLAVRAFEADAVLTA